jgi:hypothetical protein
VGWKEDIAYMEVALRNYVAPKITAIKLEEVEGAFYQTGPFEYVGYELPRRREERELIENLETELGMAPGTYRLSKIGTSPEGGDMASVETMQTMRATGGFQLPTELKGFLPLLLGFILVVFILIKK